MSSWGKNEAAEGSAETKPRYLTDAEKRDVYATTAGWTAPAGGQDRATAQREVIVSVRGLSGEAKLASANISSANWNDTTYSLAAGDTMSVSVNWNEAVTVTSGATILVTNTGTGGTHTLTAGASTSNRATFELVMAADVATWAADDVLSIGAQNITGTVVGGDGDAALVAISATHGTNAGTVTVVA